MTVQQLPDTVVLHLGAHKTASTHLQRSISAAGPLPGVAFFGPQKLRETGQSLPERFGFPLDDANGAAVPSALQGMAAGAARLVLSEENFAGKLQTGWGRIPTPLYFTAPQRVGSLAAHVANVGGPAVDVCLGVRDPIGYLTSSYSQILHGGRVVKPEKFIAKNPLNVVDWVDYVARLRAVPGIGALTVWRYEDYAAGFADICRALIGPHDITPLPERIQPRLSARAMDVVLLAKSLDGGNVVAEAAATYPVSDTSPAFTLYDQPAFDLSARLYADQWSRLRDMSGVTTLACGNA